MGRRRARSVGTRDVLAPRPPHFAPKARRVIFLFMAGAPSQLDLFDDKPTLRKFDGRPIPAEVVKDQRYAFIRPDASLMSARYRFARHGAMRRRALGDAAAPGEDRRRDRDRPVDAHRPVQPRARRRSSSTPARRCPAGRAWAHGSATGWAASPRTCPASSSYPRGRASAAARPTGPAASCRRRTRACRSAPRATRSWIVASPSGVDRRLQRDSLDLIGELNRQHLGIVGDPEIATRISSYEMAFRMQQSAPELIDLSGETPADPGALRRRAGQAVVRQ